MATIDLSKAKIGDKFRTDSGYMVQFVSLCRGSKYKYYLEGVDSKCWLRCDSKGNSKVGGKQYKLIEKVIDKADGKETKTETKRRQEVVKLAEKMYIMFENENFKYYLCNNGNCAFESEELMRLTFVRANTFINKKHQYLKEGKL